MTKRLGLRGRLTVLVGVGAVLTLATLVFAFNVLLRSSLDADADRLLQSAAAASLEGVAFHGGVPTVHESPDAGAPEAQVWVYSGHRSIERPPASTSVNRLADSLAGTKGGFVEDPATDTKLYGVPITRGGRQVGTLVTSVSLEPYERSAHRALVASLLFAAAALALIVPLARIIVNRALRPVARMTHEAADWSEHDLDHRFSAGPAHDELTDLAATFDQMLDKLSASLRREQRFSAELSHELRTPLSAMVAEAELALRHERGALEYRRALETIASRGEQMQRVLETLLAAARAEISQAPGRADVVEVAGRVVDGHRRTATERGIELLQGPQARPVRAAVDPDALERVLSPIVENAIRHASRQVRVEATATDGGVVLGVRDDGPGVSADDRERVFEPGYRTDTNGAGLGLPLARRLARAFGGEVTCEPGIGGRFSVSLPRE